MKCGWTKRNLYAQKDFLRLWKLLKKTSKTKTISLEDDYNFLDEQSSAPN